MSKDVYITAKYYAKPRNPRQTYKVGYMKDDANIQHDETIDVTLGLKNKDLESARIILNVSKQVITKNSFGGDKTFHDLFSYFYLNNREEIGDALARAGITITQPEMPVVEVDSNIIDAEVVSVTETNPEVSITADPVV
jgi:hypothetical protein